MDAQQLFWATGINNAALDTDAKAAVQIFSRLQKDVKAELDKIEKAYEATRMKTNLKFTNPVDPSMVESIKSQMRELGKVIDEQTKAVAGLSLSYDKAMQNINKATSRVGRGTGSGSPLQPTVDNVRASVAQADRELSFLERRFKYAASSIVAYGSFRWGQQFIADMIKVKGEFDQLRVAIDSFTGSAEKGAKVFGQLTRLAVKSPFELRDITNSAKQLLAYGTAAEDVADSIKMLSDVSAGSGQSIKDIAYLYGTSLTQGRLYARDLFQFANRGIPIYSELAKVMGISTKELMDQVKIGKVGFPQLQAAMENMTAAGGKYFGLSDKIAATTFGKISNLKDRWSIALNEMGNATDGMVSTSVEGITVLIENWEQVVKAIEAAVLAYGSYKAATAVGALVAGVEAYASNYREAEALNILTTAQQRSDLAKKGFVLGSVEYTAAIKAEAAAQLVNAQKALASAQIEVTANEELLASKQKLSIALGEEVLARRVALDTAKASGTIAQIETAQTELNTVSKKHSIAIEESRAAAKALNTAITEKQIVADKIELITTAQDTAAKAANTGATNLLTIAKAKLTAMSARLNAVVAANPWTAGAIAIGVLVFAIYELYDGATAAEKATKRLNKSLEGISVNIDNLRKKFEDLLNIIKNKTASDYDQIKAYQELVKLAPNLIKGMTLQQLQMSNSIKLQKEYNEQLALNEYIQKRVLEVQAKRALDRADKTLKSVHITSMYSQTELLFAQRSYDEAKAFYEGAKKEADEAKKIRDQALKKAESTPIIKNKEFWEEQKKEAEAALELLTKADVGSKKWNEIVAKINKAKEELKTWDLKESKTNPVTTQQQKAEEMLAKFKENDAKLTDAAKQAEIDRQQAIVDELKDGHAKALKQLEVNYEKEKAKIKEEGDKLLKIEQDTAYKLWLIKNPNWKKEKKTFAMPTTLSTESQGTVSTMYGTAKMNYLNSQKDMLQKMLIDLGNFDEQRREIDRKYNDQIEFLRKSRTENNKKEVDDAIAQAQRLAEEEKNKLSLEEFKKNFDWETIFGNLNIYSTNRLKELRAELKKLIETDRRLPESDKSKLIKQYNKLGDAIIKDQESLTGLFNFRTEQQDQIRLLQEEYDMRKKNYDMLVQEQKQLSANYSLNKLNLEQFLKNNGLNSNTSSINSDSISSFFTKKGDSQGLSQFQNLFSLFNQSGSQLSNITGKVQLAGQSMNDASGALKGAGGSMSGTMSMIDAIIHKINDNVQSLNELMKILGSEDTKFGRGMDSFAKSSEYATKAWDSLKGGNAVGVITGVVGSLKEAGNAIYTWFGSDTTADYENLKKELGKYIDVLDQVIDSQKEAMEGMVGNAAIIASKKVTEGIQEAIDSYRRLAESAGNAGSGMWTHSYAHRTNKSLKNYWDDISKSAGQTVDSVTDLYNMTPQQLEKIRNENAYAWSLINEDIRGYLDQIIEAGTELEDVLSDADEALTGLSFDAARDSLDDLLKDADTTFADVADNFEEYMRTAMLNMVKSEYLTDALTGWYSDFVDKTKSGNELTQTEVEQLRKDYMDIYKNAQSQYDALLDAADLQLTSSNNSTSGAISSMSQESADILTAQFSAIRINVSDILLTLQNQRPLLEMAFNDISEIAKNTRDLADIKKYLGYMWDQGLKIK